jgi:roadblock/LC7 domain-containing protein
MSVYSAIAQMPGVLAAGEYSYRGDRYSFVGDMTDEMAKMASIMCRSTSLAVHMQVNMMKTLGTDCGCSPSRGWVVNGKDFTVCVIGNHFCFLKNNESSLNQIMSMLIEQVGEQSDNKI